MNKFLSFNIGWVLLIIVCICGCQTENSKKEVSPNNNHALAVNVKYAKGFSIKEFKNYRLLTITNPWRGENSEYNYVLYKNEKPKNIEAEAFIKVPIGNIACMSLTHVAFIEKLERINTIKAVAGCDYVSHPKVREKITTGEIKEVGQHGSLNYEMLIDESPDVVMAYGIDGSSKKHLSKFKSLGLTVVLNGEYMERHPLGQAEWIKFVGALYDMNTEANEVFEEVEKNYLSTKELVVEKASNKPSVFLSMPWNGVWYMAGGKSFQAALLNDAGANYLWKDNEELSNFTIDKEVVIDKAFEADYWINLNSYKSISEIVDYDAKFKELKAVKSGNLFNNNKRLSQTNGNDYWESGIVNPDVVLKDLVEIFHPEILDHELYYYKKMP